MWGRQTKWNPKKFNNNLAETLSRRRSENEMFLKRARNNDRVNMVKMCLLAVHTTVFVNSILQTLLITIFMGKKKFAVDRDEWKTRKWFSRSYEKQNEPSRRGVVSGRYVLMKSLEDLRNRFQNPESCHGTAQFICFAVDMRVPDHSRHSFIANHPGRIFVAHEAYF